MKHRWITIHESRYGISISRRSLATRTLSNTFSASSKIGVGSHPLKSVSDPHIWN